MYIRRRYKEGEIQELNMPFNSLGRYRGVYEEEIQGGGDQGVEYAIGEI